MLNIRRKQKELKIMMCKADARNVKKIIPVNKCG